MKKISTRKNTPYFSASPWAGFTPHDRAREKPLPRCPDARCGRVKQCLAAHDGLYCQRTHFSPPEIERWRRKSPLGKAIAAVPLIADANDFVGRLKRLTLITMLKLEHQMKMKDRWQAGEFDRLHGKYAKAGRLMKPPPRHYQETPPR